MYSRPYRNDSLNIGRCGDNVRLRNACDARTLDCSCESHGPTSVAGAGARARVREKESEWEWGEENGFRHKTAYGPFSKVKYAGTVLLLPILLTTTKITISHDLTMVRAVRRRRPTRLATVSAVRRWAAARRRRRRPGVEYTSQSLTVRRIGGRCARAKPVTESYACYYDKLHPCRVVVRRYHQRKWIRRGNKNVIGHASTLMIAPKEWKVNLSPPQTAAAPTPRISACLSCLPKTSKLRR